MPNFIEGLRWFVKQHIKKWEKVEIPLPIFILTQNWKLNTAIIEIVAKKKKQFNAYKAINSLGKTSKEHKIMLGNNHNQVMLII